MNEPLKQFPVLARTEPSSAHHGNSSDNGGRV